MKLPNRVILMDVSPRDGLQSEPIFVPTEKKIALIERLIAAGVRKIEATSFVSPKWVPQMADAEALLQAVAPAHPDVTFEVLLPNEKGYDRAHATGLLKAAGFVVAATEALNVKNVNMSVADSMRQFAAIAARAKADGVRIRGTIGVSFVCPYEGKVPRARVVALADEYFNAGADEVAIADTIGRAMPNDVYAVFAAVKDRWPGNPLAGHFHDTYKMALTNIFAAMQAGADVFDCAVGNLGGCQFAKGATGNVSTEQLVYLLNGMGIETGIRHDRIVEVGQWAKGLIAPLAIEASA
ncbi:MAG: hydroxymethylglutaryl-CoA lyase [Acidobacteria bacterium]|nr:hydroxymethylglutaryl-CoA lyase [Acidobacteriota bacterium]MBI3427428.1 hydroxymethylglutaryl-CoA lyase [Acidobacteriota bacterium]